MLNAIQQYPDRLKGIAVVQHTTTFDELVNLKAQGIVGVRLNLFGLNPPALNTPDWQNFYEMWKTSTGKLSYTTEISGSAFATIK